MLALIGGLVIYMLSYKVKETKSTDLNCQTIIVGGYLFQTKGKMKNYRIWATAGTDTFWIKADFIPVFKWQAFANSIEKGDSLSVCVPIDHPFLGNYKLAYTLSDAKREYLSLGEVNQQERKSNIWMIMGGIATLVVLIFGFRFHTQKRPPKRAL